MPSTAASLPAAANNSTNIDLTENRYTVKAIVPIVPMPPPDPQGSVMP